MRKQFMSLVLCAVMTLGVSAQAVAPEAAFTSSPIRQISDVSNDRTMEAELRHEVILASGTATPASNVQVNGISSAQSVPLRAVNQTVYASLRGLAQALRPGICVNWDGNRALVWAEDLSITAVPGERYIIANGRYLYVPDGVKAENGVVMVPVKTMAKAMDATVGRCDITGLALTTGSGAIRSGDAFYNAEDLYWLSHIIYAESGNQPLEGQIAVGNVILNRKASSQCPNTVKGVVLQKNQFTPVQNGSINLTPSEKSVIAAKLCLDGGVVLGNAMYFSRADMGCWAKRNRPYVATIGAHAFYA